MTPDGPLTRDIAGGSGSLARQSRIDFVMQFCTHAVSIYIDLFHFQTVSQIKYLIISNCIFKLKVIRTYLTNMFVLIGVRLSMSFSGFSRTLGEHS